MKVRARARARARPCDHCTGVWVDVPFVRNGNAIIYAFIKNGHVVNGWAERILN